MRACYPDSDGIVVRDGVEIRYERYGDGWPAILLLPAWSLAGAAPAGPRGGSTSAQGGPEPRAAEGEHGEDQPLARSEHDGTMAAEVRGPPTFSL